jgi:hypothetical protein
MNTHTDVMSMGQLHDRGYTSGDKQGAARQGSVRIRTSVNRDADRLAPRCSER